MKMLAYKLAQVIMVPLLLAVPFVVSTQNAHAAFLGDSRVSLSTSQAGAVSSHEVAMGYTSVTNVGSIEIEYCTNSPFPGQPCTAPVGFDATGSTLSSESGEVGFSKDVGNSTATRVVLTRASVPVTVVNPVLSRYLLTNMQNPTSAGTVYVRLSTYASIDATGPFTDEGGIAISYTEPVTVSTFVPPVLLFCVAVSIPTNDCSSASGDGVDFGDFTTTSTSAGSVQMLAATNGIGGYTITSTGTTMTSGNNVIPAIAPRGPSQIGQSQFGLNLRNNATPNIGADTTGAGTGVPDPDYNVPNQFFFSDGDVIARSPLSTRINKFTASYIVNINDNQSPGVYATTITFTALAAF